MQKLPVIQINEPCSQDWDSMSGDAKRRFCDTCEKHVLNFDEMSTAEVSAAMTSPGNDRICARIRRLPDGSIITKDSKPRLRRSVISRVSQFTTLATAFFLAGCSSKEAQQSEMTGMVGPSQSQVAEMGDVVAVPEEQLMILGEACVVEDVPDRDVDLPTHEMGRAIVPQDPVPGNHGTPE